MMSKMYINFDPIDSEHSFSIVKKKTNIEAVVDNRVRNLFNFLFI